MIRILIDPGHAWNGNHYALNPNYYEGTQMWHLANYLKIELERYGFEVKTTRPNLKDYWDVSDRGKMAKGYDLLISLHSNAIPGNDKVTGTFIYRTLSTPGIKPLADDMGQRIANLMGHSYRGTITKESGKRPGKDYNGVLRNAIAVGCKAGLLVEHGFHTNPKDCAFLVNNDNLKKLAIAEAEAIANYYYKGEKTLNYLDNTNTLYRGVKNDFVRQLQEDLISLGYDLSPHGADGSFGAKTETAVMQWQRNYSLEEDGRFGGGSRRKMTEIKKAKEEAPKPVDDTSTVKYWRDMYNLQAGVVKDLQVEIAKIKELARQIYQG